MGLQEDAVAAAAAQDASSHMAGMRISGDHQALGPDSPAVAAGRSDESFANLALSPRALRVSTLPSSLAPASTRPPWDMLRDALRASSDPKAARPSATRRASVAAIHSSDIVSLNQVCHVLMPSSRYVDLGRLTCSQMISNILINLL